ncbi:MAG: HAD family phosphatase [Corynebacterium sp.]|nr:HAD family phosphatase [Corynebacterium sp.]
MLTTYKDPSRPRAVFWDMDGTLTDTEPLWGIATYELAELLGGKLTPELRAKTVGGTFASTLEICAATAQRSLTPEDYPRYREWMFKRVSELFADQLTVFPGVRELLSELKAAGIPMLVTTNTVRSLADPAIAAIGSDYFTGSICGDEVERGKPAPDMYVEAARRARCSPGQAVVFEDSTAGMTAATAAGCFVIGLPADERIVIPDGVVPISSLHSSNHLDGVTVQNIFDWFKENSQL